jgi:hypothetical protein
MSHFLVSYRLVNLRVCAAAAFLCFSALCTADETAMASTFKRFMEAPDSPVILRGDYLQAVLVAYKDFSKILAARSAQASDPDLSKLQNYDISIDQTAATVIVQFGPTVRDKAHVVFGGGAQYVVDRSTFAIMQKTLLK